MIDIKCDCGVPYQFYCRCEKAEQYYDFYQCPKCGKPSHEIVYKYHPLDGKHKCQYEFIGTVFVDDFHAHKLFQRFRCDLCGNIHDVPRDLRSAGFSGRVEIDHPKVENTLLLNQSVYERLVPKEEREAGRGKYPKEAELPDEAHV